MALYSSIELAAKNRKKNPENPKVDKAMLGKKSLDVFLVLVFLGVFFLFKTCYYFFDFNLAVHRIPYDWHIRTHARTHVWRAER